MAFDYKANGARRASKGASRVAECAHVKRIALSTADHTSAQHAEALRVALRRLEMRSLALGAGVVAPCKVEEALAMVAQVREVVERSTHEGAAGRATRSASELLATSRCPSLTRPTARSGRRRRRRRGAGVTRCSASSLRTPTCSCARPCKRDLANAGGYSRERSTAPTTTTTSSGSHLSRMSDLNDGQFGRRTSPEHGVLEPGRSGPPRRTAGPASAIARHLGVKS